MFMSLAGCSKSGYLQITRPGTLLFPLTVIISLEMIWRTTRKVSLGFTMPQIKTLIFSELTTGGRIRIKIVVIFDDSSPPYTEVYDYKRLSKGSEENIDKSTLDEIYQLSSLADE